MPLYDYKCPTCGARFERMLKLAELDQTQTCAHCGAAMNRQLSAPMVVGDYPGYECPITGKWIEGRRAHNENLARHECRILEPGETAEAEKRRRASDEALERAIDETADRLIADLPTEKRDRLAAEMENGLDAQLTRQTPQGT